MIGNVPDPDPALRSDPNQNPAVLKYPIMDTDPVEWPKEGNGMDPDPDPIAH